MRIVLKYLPWALVAVLTVTLVVLSSKHRKLREDFLEHRRADGRAAVGMFVPMFTAKTTDGADRTIGSPATGGSQILLYLTSTCPYCKVTLPYWKQLPQRLAARSALKTELIGVTTDSVSTAAGYAQANALPFVLVPFPDRKLEAMYRAFSTPQTVVIDSTGRVIYARHGVIGTVAAIDSVIAAATDKRPAVRSTRAGSTSNGKPAGRVPQ